VRTHACDTAAGRASGPVAVYCGKDGLQGPRLQKPLASAEVEADPEGLGILLVAFGLLGFLPVLGFWMIPVGLLVLSVDLPVVRRWRRKLTVWWHRRNEDL
jgi:hypothetical protein